MRVRPYQPSDLETIMEIKRKKHAEWFPDRPGLELFSPNDPTVLGVVVIADDLDSPVAAIGARSVAELGTAIDDTRINPHQLRHYLPRAWVKLGVQLHRFGYQTAYARVSSPTPAWGRVLETIGRFQKSPDEHFYFSLEAVAKRLKAV